jgi:hypothetical protein
VLRDSFKVICSHMYYQKFIWYDHALRHEENPQPVDGADQFDSMSGHPIESCTPTHSAEAVFPSSTQKQYTKRLLTLLKVASGTASWSWHTIPC